MLFFAMENRKACKIVYTWHIALHGFCSHTFHTVAGILALLQKKIDEQVKGQIDF